MNIKRFFLRKDLQQLTNEANNSHDLEKTLTAFDLILLGIGAIIGAGVFVFIGAGVTHAGPAVILSFVLGGLGCACAALCYAELAAAIPLSGSVYSYTYATLGELPAFLISGCLILTYGFAAAAVASGWSGYVVGLLHDFNIILPQQWLHHTGQIIQLENGQTLYAIMNLPALLIVALLSWVVYFGSNASAMLNTVIVIIKMSVLFAFIALGFFHIEPSNWVPFIPKNTGEFGHFGFSGIIAGASSVFLAYMGFDAVATAAQEAKNPQRDLPIGILGSLLICTLMYALIAAVLTGMINYTHLIGSSKPLAVAVKIMNMPWFSLVIQVGAIAGLTSVVLVLLYACVRVLYPITVDGLLPPALGAFHKKHHTPYILTGLVGISVTILASLFNVEHLGSLASFGALACYSMVCFNVIYMRFAFPNLVRPFKCPLVPIIPLSGIAMFTLIMYGLKKEIFIYAGQFMFVLILIYVLYGRCHSKVQKATV